MFKKRLLVLLVLFMVVFLFAGCTSKNGGDTSLEGTWRLTRETWDLDQEEPDWVEYPLTVMMDVIFIQPYYQLKNGVYKEFEKTTVVGKSVIAYNDYDMYKYEVKEDENIFTIYCYDEYDDDWYFEDEYEYIISGNKISVRSTYYGWHGWEAVKVSDSEVAGAIPGSEVF